VGTSLSSALTLLPAASVVVCALLAALVLARLDNRNERLRAAAGWRPRAGRPRSGAPRPAGADALPAGHRVPTRWVPYLIFPMIPLWWAMGLSFFQWPLIVAPLIYPLCRRRDVRAPRRFGIWLAFLLWTVLSAVEIHSGSRAIAWAWRDSFYVASTILFLYIYNSSERRLPTRTVVNALAALWVLIVVGGWAGVLFPTLSLASPAEHVFPKSLLHNTYFYAHVHLQLAEVQHFLGFREGRPQTFFAYTNAWGSTFAMMTPFALGALAVSRRGVWRRLLQAALVASIVPGVFSLDRGMWLSLAVGLGYATIRLAARHDVQMVAKIVTIVALVIVVIVVSPLGALVAGRFTHKTGDSSRLARDQVAQAQITANPILGYGSPQQATTLTHTQKSVGTESEVFLLLYSHGVPGLFFCAVWLAYTVFRSGRIRRGDSPLIFWTHVALLTACVQVPFYELTERMPIMFAAAALLHRRIAQAAPELPPDALLPRRPRVAPEPASAVVVA
jgi:polysaccharide biosynthesis protein PslJ